MFKVVNSDINIDKMIVEIPTYKLEVVIDLYKSINCNCLPNNPRKRKLLMERVASELLNEFKSSLSFNSNLLSEIENDKVRTVIPCSFLKRLSDNPKVFSISIVVDEVVEKYKIDCLASMQFYLINSLNYFYVEGDSFANLSNEKTYVLAKSSIEAFNKFFYATYIFNPAVSISSIDFKRTLRYNVIKTIEIDRQLYKDAHPSYFNIMNPFKSKLVEPPNNLFRFAYLYEMHYPNLSYDYQSYERINPRFIDGNKEMLGEFYKIASSKLYKNYLRLNRSKLFVL